MKTIIWIFLEFCVEYANWLTISLGMLLSIASWLASKKHNSEQLRSYVPTIWTSLGIFFTFLSIYVTLTNMASLSDDQIQITRIIRGIIPAFSTSVIGILGAIITAYLDRWIKSSEEAIDNSNFEDFRDGKLVAKNQSQAPDLILLELVREIHASISETHRLLGSISQDTVKTLKNNNDFVIKAINDQKEETIKNQNQVSQDQRRQLQEYVEKFVSEANEAHRKQIEEIIAKFNEDSEKREEKHIVLLRELKDAAKTNIESIKDSLCKEAESRQADMKKFIEGVKSELSTFVFGQNRMLEEALQQYNITINSAVEKISTLFESKIMSDIELFAQMFYEKSEKVLKDQEESNADYLKSLSGILQETHTNITNDIHALKETIILHLNELHEENALKMKGILDQHSDDFRAVSESTHKLDKDYLTSLAKEIEKLYNNLNSRTETLEKEHLKNVERIHQESEDKIKVADESLEKEISRMIGNIQELRTSVESSSNSYISKHDEIKKQISDTTSQLINEISKKFSDSAQISAIETACISLNEKLQLTIKALDQKYQKINDSMENVATSLETFSKAANETESLNKYVLSTIDLYKEHSSSVKALEDSLEKMTEIINSALISLKNASLNNKQDEKRKVVNSK